MRQVLGPGALGRPRGIWWRRRWEGGLGWGIHVSPWLIHVNVWQNPLKCCEIISLQLMKINEKKKHRLFCSQPSLWPNSHLVTWLQTIVLTIWTFVGKVTSPLFNTLSKFVIALLPRSKHLLSFNFMAAVTLGSDFGAQETFQCFLSFSIYLPLSDGSGMHWS